MHSTPLFSASHPFNPATAPSAILMPLNADEVKMCLKERIAAGRAAAHMHKVRNTHTLYNIDFDIYKHIVYLNSDGLFHQMLSL